MSPIADNNAYYSNLKHSTGLTDTVACIKAMESVSANYGQVCFGISANISIHQLEISLQKHCLLHSKRAKVIVGDYSAHISNLEKFKREKVDYAIFINFFDALMPSLEANASLMNEALIQDLKLKIRTELNIIFKDAGHFKLIIFPQFHLKTSTSLSAGKSAAEDLVDDLNQILREEGAKVPQCLILNTSNLLRRMGDSIAMNDRFYYAYKTPYTLSFFDELASDIAKYTQGFGSRYLKALVLDCDNTIWGGIIGEDQIDGIQLNPNTYPANIFWTIQNKVKQLKQQGILISICSKNNQADVDEVLRAHPHCVLSESDIIIKKINWENKSKNIDEISKELGISLDSIVFLDDSEFECNEVRAHLPDVNTYMVPKNLYDFPKFFEDITEFFPFSHKPELMGASKKTEQYRIRALAEKDKNSHATAEDYFKSLDMKLKIFRNRPEQAIRIAELSNKTNQFNLTTRRYTVSEILNFFQSESHLVYSFEFNDKFGTSGITAAVILKLGDTTVSIDTFLMSCRIIGRGAEYGIWELLLRQPEVQNRKNIYAEYIASPKNRIVADFYSTVGLNTLSHSADKTTYRDEIKAVLNRHGMPGFYGEKI